MEVWAGSCVKQALKVHSTSVVRFDQVCYTHVEYEQF